MSLKKSFDYCAQYSAVKLSELSCSLKLTSYHADISLINKQYRKRGHKLHRAAKNSTNNHRPNGQTCLRIFASKRKSGSNLLKDIKKRRIWYLIQRHVFFSVKNLKLFFESVKLPNNFLALLDEDMFKSNTATPPHFYLF